jgi:hypothetical protein
MDQKNKAIENKKSACEQVTKKIEKFLKDMNAVTLPNGKTVII